MCPWQDISIITTSGSSFLPLVLLSADEGSDETPALVSWGGFMTIWDRCPGGTPAGADKDPRMFGAGDELNAWEKKKDARDVT